MSKKDDDAPDVGERVTVYAPPPLEELDLPSSPPSLGSPDSFYMENPDTSPQFVYRIELEDPTLTLYPPGLPPRRLH